MRKLSLSILAASTVLIATAASAEDQRGGGQRPNAGHSWRGGGMQMQRGGGNMQMRHGGNVQVRNHGGNVRVRHNMPNMRMHHGGGRGHPGRGFRHSRLQRGGFIHGFWFGSQFHINNWQVYGLANPGADYRWVRYYDDACMIDREGRVRDCRYGMDWDRYGEQWGDDDGIPAYRDRHHDESEYEEHAESRSEGWDYGAYGHPGPGPHGPAPMPMPAPGATYGGYYGYGAYAYPIVIETITTTGCGCEEVVEEVIQVRQHRRRTPPRPRPPRRPPPGERG